MKQSVLAEIAALKGMSLPQLKLRWRELNEGPPPPYNRRFLESRLIYRVQELAHGGTSREVAERLDGLAYALDKGRPLRAAANLRPIAGTRLIREWQGAQHVVTVREADFEWQGRPYKSLSSIAREIAGTRWNGWVFFGLKVQKSKP